MTKYFIANNNQRLGPLEMNELLQNGLVPDSLVWCKGMPGWEKAKNVPELATLMSSSTEIPPQLPNQSAVYQQSSIPQQPYSQPHPSSVQEAYNPQYPNPQQYGQYPQPSYRSSAPIVQEKPQNKYGLIGFVFSICSLFIVLIPLLNLISPFTWLAGLILSIMGLHTKPNGLAIAGLIISLSGIVFFIFAIMLGFMLFL